MGHFAAVPAIRGVEEGGEVSAHDPGVERDLQYRQARSEQRGRMLANA
jgi:hypothetical protein